ARAPVKDLGPGDGGPIPQSAAIAAQGSWKSTRQSRPRSAGIPNNTPPRPAYRPWYRGKGVVPGAPGARRLATASTHDVTGPAATLDVGRSVAAFELWGGLAYSSNAPAPRRCNQNKNLTESMGACMNPLNNHRHSLILGIVLAVVLALAI